MRWCLLKKNLHKHLTLLPQPLRIMPVNPPAAAASSGEFPLGHSFCPKTRLADAVTWKVNAVRRMAIPACTEVHFFPGTLPVTEELPFPLSM